MVAALVGLLLLAGDAENAKDELVWRTAETVEKGGDKTFVVAGTRKGGRYTFRARGQCKKETVTWVWVGRWHQGQWRQRESTSRIFGADFRVAFGSGERQILNLGENKPEQTQLTFVADRDNVPIRVLDNWDVPKDIRCSVDGIEVVAAEVNAEPVK